MHVCFKNRGFDSNKPKIKGNKSVVLEKLLILPFGNYILPVLEDK